MHAYRFIACDFRGRFYHAENLQLFNTLKGRYFWMRKFRMVCSSPMQLSLQIYRMQVFGKQEHWYTELTRQYTKISELVRLKPTNGKGAQRVMSGCQIEPIVNSSDDCNSLELWSKTHITHVNIGNVRGEFMPRSMIQYRFLSSIRPTTHWMVCASTTSPLPHFPTPFCTRQRDTGVQILLRQAPLV